MNVDKLRKMAGDVRIGGKGTVRRKKKAVTVIRTTVLIVLAVATAVAAGTRADPMAGMAEDVHMSERAADQHSHEHADRQSGLRFSNNFSKAWPPRPWQNPRRARPPEARGDGHTQNSILQCGTHVGRS